MPFKDPETAKAYWRDRARKYRAANREKVNAYCRAWRKKYPDRQKKSCDAWRANNPDKQQALVERSKPRRSLMRRARMFGLTPEAVTEFLAAHTSCEICGGAPEHIDHDHVTGNLRGMLCARCNLLLGHAADNQHTLICAVSYLAKYSLAEKVLASALRKGQTLHEALDKRPGGK